MNDHSLLEQDDFLARIGKLEEELRVTEELLAERQRVLDAIPACPAHGPCVPHALEWIKNAKGKSIDCGCRTETICDKIAETARRFDHDTGKWPTNVYLGRNEWKELSRRATEGLGLGLAEKIQATWDVDRPAVDGLSVFQVDADDHLACG